MSALDDAVARVNASAQTITTSVQSAVQAINDLRAQLAAGLDTSAAETALGHIADQLDGANTALTQAVTPPAPAAETPVDAPSV